VTVVGTASARAKNMGDRRSRLTRGLIAGALATAAEATWTRAQVKMLGRRQPLFTPELMVNRMVLAATGHSVDRRVVRALGVLMTSGYGPAWAAAWVLIRGGREPRLVRDSCVLGGIIWVFEVTTLPNMRATPPLRHWTAKYITLDLSNGLVFAVVTNAVVATHHWSQLTTHDRREFAGPRR
jgi:hypothetical protein